MKKLACVAVFGAILFAAALCGNAAARDYKADPAAQFLKDREGEEWDKIREAHQNDWAVRGVSELEGLAEKRRYIPEAVFTILMMAYYGDKAAEKYILDHAEAVDGPAGALAVMGSIFLDHEKTFPRLISRLGRKSSNGGVTRGAAGSAIAGMTGVCMGPDEARWRKWWEENKGKFKPDNRMNLDIFRYEIEYGPLTGKWAFDGVAREDYFIELLMEFNDKVKKFTGERWPMEKAFRAMGEGRFEDARKAAEAGLGDYPADGYALYMAGCMALQTGDIKAALKYFKKLVSLNEQMGSAKLLADYCKGLISAKKTDDLDALLKLFRKLPRDTTRWEWDVPTIYIFDRAFKPSQENIKRFAREKVNKPELLAGAVMMLGDADTSLDLLNAGIKNNPNNSLLRMLRLQFLIQSGIRKNSEQIIEEIRAISLLDGDNGLLDCLAMAAADPETLEQMGMSGCGTPLTESEINALVRASLRRRFTRMSERKAAALVAALREMGSPVPLSIAAQTCRETVLPKMQQFVIALTERAEVNIAEAVAKGDMKQAEKIYALLNLLASRILKEDKSFYNGSIALMILRNAENGMTEGYKRRGENDKADKRWKQFNRRAEKMGISPIYLDDFRYIRKIPVPGIAEAVSAAILSDERGLHGKYPPVYKDNE